MRVLLAGVVSAQQTSRRARVRARELVGRQWLNTGGKELRLVDFRGKVLVLDFWTLQTTESTLPTATSDRC